MFWPDADDEAARGALRRTLSALRTAVGDQGLIIDGPAWRSTQAPCSVDLLELTARGLGSASDLEAAADLARGPFLAGFALRDSPAFDDWQAARSGRVEGWLGRCWIDWPRRGPCAATQLGRSRPPAGASSSTRWMSPVSGESSNCSPVPVTDPAPSASIAPWSHCSTASSAWRPCARRPTCTRPSARTGRSSRRTSYPESHAPAAIDTETAVTTVVPRPVLVGRDDDLAAIMRATTLRDPRRTCRGRGGRSQASARRAS